jgi:hypothetical protein
MNKITDIEAVKLSEKDQAFLGKAIATRQGGRQFIILAADNDSIEEAWRRLGGLYPPDFSQVKSVAIVSREFFDSVRPAHETSEPPTERPCQCGALHEQCAEDFRRGWGRCCSFCDHVHEESA